ncbi:hypothetical protein ARTHRO9AX_210133 [Arthrobacter sp. 9AX]|nr:hypothetical protein ARTHRO9AX_210133 [Arthrobacter sp. 9AX]
MSTYGRFRAPEPCLAGQKLD